MITIKLIVKNMKLATDLLHTKTNLSYLGIYYTASLVQYNSVGDLVTIRGKRNETLIRIKKWLV
jgi:hypothetical protein